MTVPCTERHVVAAVPATTAASGSLAGDSGCTASSSTAALRFVNTVVPRDQLDGAVAELAARLAVQPRFALRSTKQQVNAVIEEMVGTGRNANDADSLVVALHDPESREAARRYLTARQSPKA